MKTWRAAKERIRALLKLDLSFKQGSHCLLGLLRAPSEVSSQGRQFGQKKGNALCISARTSSGTPSTSRSGNSSGRGGFTVSTASKVPCLLPRLGFGGLGVLFCFFPCLFGSESDSGYQTPSGFGPWNASAFQKARKLPRITKRQVRILAFRKQPYYSAMNGLWREKNN